MMVVDNKLRLLYVWQACVLFDGKTLRRVYLWPPRRAVAPEAIMFRNASFFLISTQYFQNCWGLFCQAFRGVVYGDP